MSDEFKKVYLLIGNDPDGRDEFIKLLYQISDLGVHHYNFLDPIRDAAKGFLIEEDIDSSFLTKNFIMSLKRASESFNNFVIKELLSAYRYFLKTDDELLVIDMEGADHSDIIYAYTILNAEIILISKDNEDEDIYDCNIAYHYYYNDNTPKEEFKENIIEFLNTVRSWS